MMQDLDPAQADDEPDVPRGVWAARRADELARRIAELQDDAKPPTENDVALARQREKEAHYRARRAHLADAERHEEAARIHEETAAMHEQAVIDQIGDE